MNLEEIIKNLPPELQEKARACKSTEELKALGKEKLTSLPPGEMERIAGGRGTKAQNCIAEKCPRCGSTNVSAVSELSSEDYVCKDCGYQWRVDFTM